MIVHQPLKISLRQLVDNPTGKGSAYMAKRAMIKQGLNMTYIKILSKYRKHFYAVPYIYNDGRVLFHVKVPSEMYNINKISYDVLFEFDNDERKRLSMRTVKCFSNSPSFIFTYAYVFNAKSMIIPQFKNNLPKQCLTQAPVVRNPIESMGYEKSIYLASRYLLDSFALGDAYIHKYGKQYNKLEEIGLQRRIADPETLVAVYQHALYIHRKTHRKELDANEKKARDERNRKFADQQKRFTPEGRRGLFGIRSAPRAKITARKAKKALLNDGMSPSRIIRPKKKV